MTTRTNIMLGSAFLGGAAGYYLGTFVGCYRLYPGSHLCGLVGTFGIGPIGLIVGGAVGWMASRKDERDQR